MALAFHTLAVSTVVIVEESTGKNQPMRLGAFLNGSTGCRVVTLSLNHEFATVYHRNRMAATDPAELVKAIRGNGKRKQSQVAGPYPQQGKVAKATRPAAGRRSMTS